MLTLYECNAIPISDLFIARICEEIPSDNRIKLLSAKQEEVDINVSDGTKSELKNCHDNFMKDPFFEAHPNLAEDIFNTAFVLCADVNYIYTTILYRLHDGQYLNLNGYSNKLVDSNTIKFIKPLKDYFQEGTFRFKVFPTSPEELQKVIEEDFDGYIYDMPSFAKGIYCDFDDTKPIERFDREYQALKL